MEKLLFVVPPYVSFDNFVNPTKYSLFANNTCVY